MAKVVGVYTEEKVDQLLDQGMLDKATRRKLASFLEQIEVAVFTANREIIHRAIPDLDRDRFVHFGGRGTGGLRQIGAGSDQEWPGAAKGRP